MLMYSNVVNSENFTLSGHKLKPGNPKILQIQRHTCEKFVSFLKNIFFVGMMDHNRQLSVVNGKLLAGRVWAIENCYIFLQKTHKQFVSPSFNTTFLAIGQTSLR